MKYRVSVDLVEVFEEGHEGALLIRASSRRMTQTQSREVLEKAVGAIVDYEAVLDLVAEKPQ